MMINKRSDYVYEYLTYMESFLYPSIKCQITNFLRLDWCNRLSGWFLKSLKMRRSLSKFASNKI